MSNEQMIMTGFGALAFVIVFYLIVSIKTYDGVV